MKSTSVEDASERERRHDRGRGKAQLGREDGTELSEASDRTKQSSTGSDYSIIGQKLALYFACLPILYFPVNRFPFHADPRSSWEAGYTLEMERQGRASLAPRYTKAPSVSHLEYLIPLE
jgi:hypothetical protein